MPIQSVANPNQRIPQFLSFRTDNANDSDASVCTAIGTALQVLLINALQSIGFMHEDEDDWNDADWVFFARRNADRIGVSLSLLRRAPCRWFVCIIDHSGPVLAGSTLQHELHQPLQMAITQWPTATELQWHTDHVLLRTLFNTPPYKH